MDNSNKPYTSINPPRCPLGMTAFGNEERTQLGHSLRLALPGIFYYMRFFFFSTESAQASQVGFWMRL